MSVQPDGELDVVVFNGIVDFEHLQQGHKAEHLNSAASETLRSRLTTGEAVRIKPDGSSQRIVSINADRFAWAATGNEFAEKQTVIRSINDTIRTPGAGPFYEIVHGGLRDDAYAYVDRPHEWNGIDKQEGIPEFLRNADYIRTFNDDKTRGKIEITVELAQPADLYIFWDNRAAKPSWLLNEFSDTGLKIGLDEAPFRSLRLGWTSIGGTVSGKSYNLQPGVGPGDSIDVVYSIWHRKVSESGPVKLGPTLGEKYTKGAMYGIAAVAIKSNEN